MATGVAQPNKLSKSANAKTWWFAFCIYKKQRLGREITAILVFGFLILAFATVDDLLLPWLAQSTQVPLLPWLTSFLSHADNVILLPGWAIWLGFFLLARYEINKIRRKWERFKK